MIVMASQGRGERRSTGVWKVPEPSKEREIEMLRTTLGLDVAMPVEYHTFHHPIDTDTARRRENNHRVRASEAQIERVGIVAINNPAFSDDEVALNVRELVSRRLGPPRIPVDLVKVNDGNARNLT